MARPHSNSGSKLNFQLEARCPTTRARATRFRTLSGEALTPMFMPVATVGAIRGQSHGAIDRVGATVILANTYHLLLRPGVSVLEKFKGLPGWMGWKKGILTDSGGFQIFSLPNARRMTEEGAQFQSYVDGDRYLLTPELSIGVQRAIGSDIRMVLDQCVPSTSNETIVREAMELTHRWAARSLAAHGDDPQSTFAIIQGACSPEMRRESASFLTELRVNGQGFDGFAIGGLAVGETKAEREDTTEIVTALMPEDRPRYLMGVGTPIDLLEGVKRGVDLFDCIIPSAWAQQGTAFSWRGRIDLVRGVYKDQDGPIDSGCDCHACGHYTRSFLHHLVKCGEALGWQLIGEHNQRFYQRFTASMRASILEGTFADYYRANREVLATTDDLDYPKDRPSRIPRKTKAANETHLGDYEIIPNAAGTHSIRQISSGEVMHSVSDPGEEARRLYVEQPALESRFAESDVEPLVIWDVGMGAAHNAMAVIASASAESARRPLRLWSFENDLDSLKLALRFPLKFTHLRHPAPHLLLRDSAHVWRSRDERIEWVLRAGDFRAEYPNVPRPDVILFDPFSHKADGELWGVQFFEELCAWLGDAPAALYTYSNSTAVRSALIAAGFWVAAGRGTGPKSETTIAYTAAGWRARAENSEGPGLLGEDWLGRWERSTARLPLGAREEDRAVWESRLRAAAQFQPKGGPHLLV